MMRGGFLLCAALALGGCGQTYAEKQAEALAAEPKIAPGIYGDVRLSAESGDLGGMELRLDQGSDSRTVAFVRCEGWCNAVERRPARRGLGGLTFASEQAGRVYDVTVQPDGPRAVMVSVDWGQGLVQRRLPMIEREFGLAAARRETP